MRRALPPLLLAALLIAGCNSPERESSQGAIDGTNRGLLVGTVLEQIPAPPYLYLRLKTRTGEVWAAVSAASVETGSEVTVTSPMLMKAFESTSLKRTFDEIYFGALAPGGVAGGASGANPHAGVTSGAMPIDVGQVPKAEGADARTVAEAWAQREALDGRTVTIRGVVVKVNEGVMGKNWIHLQDGSGDAGRGTNDITVTTLDRAAVGETIVITGTVRTDRDLGAGYVYRVLVEEGRVKR